MRKGFKITAVLWLLLICVLFGGCRSARLYSDDEMHELHDVIGYIEKREFLLQRVIGGSLPEQIGKRLQTDSNFARYLATRQIDPTKPMIALTFDDGPHNDSTNMVLDVLEEYHVPATFFVVGECVGPGTEETLKRAVSLGCEIGNHTLNHEILTSVDTSEMDHQIQATNDLIRQYAGTECTLLRPPGGAYDDNVSEYCRQHGLPMIHWMLDTEDWRSRNADSIISEVRNYKGDGYIVLMHDIYESTAQAVKTIVPELLNDGYQLVTVSELAYLYDTELEPGGLYFAFDRPQQGEAETEME